MPWVSLDRGLSEVPLLDHWKRAGVGLLILGICILPALCSANPIPALQRARAQFESADALLNKTYQSIEASLTKEQRAELRRLQRDWLPYRDAEAVSLITFNADTSEAPDHPENRPEYWDNRTSLTRERIEFLTVYSGRTVSKGIAGHYDDFHNGELTLTETKRGIVFSCTVVRGPKAHVGEISGTAQLHGNRAIYREHLDRGENRQPAEMTFTFIDQHIVKIEGKNTDEYAGMGVSFNGMYYKTKD
ncbi:MAG: lysozyme inhibitor LprI family protein [Chthoniobacteraceae bacterium]